MSFFLLLYILKNRDFLVINMFAQPPWPRPHGGSKEGPQDLLMLNQKNLSLVLILDIFRRKRYICSLRLFKICTSLMFLVQL